MDGALDRDEVLRTRSEMLAWLECGSHRKVAIELRSCVQDRRGTHETAVVLTAYFADAHHDREGKLRRERLGTVSVEAETIEKAWESARLSLPDIKRG